MLNVHDSCGVNNLHGIPGVLSALLSILFSAIASKDDYGERLNFSIGHICPIKFEFFNIIYFTIVYFNSIIFSLYIEFPAMAPSNQTLIDEIQVCKSKVIITQILS